MQCTFYLWKHKALRRMEGFPDLLPSPEWDICAADVLQCWSVAWTDGTMVLFWLSEIPPFCLCLCVLSCCSASLFVSDAFSPDYWQLTWVNWSHTHTHTVQTKRFSPHVITSLTIDVDTRSEHRVLQISEYLYVSFSICWSNSKHLFHVFLLIHLVRTL